MYLFAPFINNRRTILVLPYVTAKDRGVFPYVSLILSKLSYFVYARM